MWLRVALGIVALVFVGLGVWRLPQDTDPTAGIAFIIAAVLATIFAILPRVGR